MSAPQPHTPNGLQRRTCLALAGATGLMASVHAMAQTLPSPLAQELKGRRLSPEGVVLDFPPLADTGNAVPLRAEVQAPAGLNIVAIEVFLPENPNPSVIKLRLIEPQPRYAFTTRLRLAASQDAWVVATLSDGSQRAASAPTVITSSACFDGT